MIPKGGKSKNNSERSLKKEVVRLKRMGLSKNEITRRLKRVKSARKRK